MLSAVYQHCTGHVTRARCTLGCWLLSYSAQNALRKKHRLGASATEIYFLMVPVQGLAGSVSGESSPPGMGTVALSLYLHMAFSLCMCAHTHAHTHTQRPVSLLPLLRSTRIP